MDIAGEEESVGSVLELTLNKACAVFYEGRIKKTMGENGFRCFGVSRHNGSPAVAQIVTEFT